MLGLRLYREFYLINHTPLGENYTLINPITLTVNTYNTTTTDFIETIAPTSDSLGLYYVDLNQSLYSTGVTYELRWNVQYVNNSPIKILKNFFQYQGDSSSGGNTFVQNNIFKFGEIDFEYEVPILSYEIQEQNEIIIELENNR